MYAAAKHINAIMPKDKGAEPARNLYAHADYDGCLTLTDVSGRIPLLSIQKPMEGQDLTVIAPIDKSGDLLFSQAILDNSINADEAHSPLRKLIQGVLALAESSRSTTATMIAGVIENHEIVGLFNTSAPNGPALTEHLKIASPAASVKSY